MVTQQDLLDAAFASYGDNNNSLPPGFVKSSNPSQTIDDPSTGLYVTTYVNQSNPNEYIVAFRGTENTRDWINNANRGWPQYAQNQDQIQGLLNTLTASGAQVNITGHSLGGALAQFAAYDYASAHTNAGSHISLTTWNALGGQWALEENRNFDSSVMDGISATHYFRYDDLVSQLGKGHIGGQAIELYDPNGAYDHILDAHGKQALQDGLTLGGSIKLPNYLSISDIGQFVAGNMADGILKIHDGKYGEGLAHLANSLIALQLPGVKEMVSADLGVIIGTALGHEAIALGQQGAEWVKNEIDQLVHASIDTAVDLALTAKMIGQAAVELAKSGIAEANDIIDTVAHAIGDAIIDVSDAAQVAADAIGQFIADGYYNSEGFIESILDQAGDWFGDLTKWFNDATKVLPPPVLIDPIILDLDGDGIIEMIPRQDNNIFFDMDGDGLKEWTGWINKDDAFLAIDENNNGVIDSVKELIGEQNTSGFTELKNYDSNGDKILDSKDTLWTQIKVWQDANVNGITDTGELKTLADVGIKAIDLHYTAVNLTAAGNQIHETSIFERTNGTTGTIVDAWLDVDRLAAAVTSLPTGNVTVDTLPDIRGFGDVASLHNAMFSDGTLATLVANSIALSIDQISNLRGVAEQIIYRWTDTQDIATNSRGANFDGRKLAVLEKFVGHSFINTLNQTNPNAQAAPLLNRAWDKLLDTVQARLAIEGPLKGTLPIVYDSGADRFISLYDTDHAISTLKTAQPSDTLQAAKFWGAFIPVINRIEDDAGGNSTAAAHTAKITVALAAMGLDKFQNALVSGVQSAILPTSGNFVKNGVYQLTDASETVSLAGSTQAIYALGGNDTLIAKATTATDTFVLDGGSGNDILRGSANADWLNGGTGADTMTGSTGDDIYFVDDRSDIIRENRNEGNDTVRSTISYVLGDNVENLELLGSDNLNGTGNALANKITGNSGVNVLTGYDGNDNLDGGGNADTLIGGLGNDTYTLDNTADVIVEKFNAGIDTVQANFSYVLANSLENLLLLGTDNLNGTGNSADNTITGNIGNNVLDGKAGNDTLKGDAGDDIYWVDTTADKAIEVSNAGTDSVNSSATYTLAANIENLTLLDDADINGTGNASNNTIIGNSGANSLDGKAGADTLSGGASDDIYAVDNIGDVVLEINDNGIDTVNSSVSFTLGDYIENLTLLAAAAINGTGNALDNQITGNTGINNLAGGAGNDLLDGKAGADSLDGGIGDDIYIVDNVGDKIIEASNAGVDTVQSSVAWVLGADIENLTLLGAAAINATGNGLANSLIGNTGKNSLDGKGGSDMLMGLAGDDTYFIDNIADQVIENANDGIDTVNSPFDYALGNNVENLILLNSALNGAGNALNNTIIGNANNNLLTGNDGNDALDGGTGADTLIGGMGNDTYTVDNLADIVVEGWNKGLDNDTVQSSISYTLGKNIENLLLLAASSINGIGNTLNNTITGNAADNILDGKAGNDTLKGGGGNDTYYIDSANDVISEATASGTDNVYSSVSYVLGNNVENLTLLGIDDINGTGNSLGNVLIGNSGANILDGKAGADTLSGDFGDDSYVIDNLGDVIVENADAGTDTVSSTLSYTLANNLENLTLLGTAALNGTGNNADNILIGNAGNNNLLSGSGNDVLDGGAGVDTLDGGQGDDTYVIDNASDKLSEASNAGTDTVQSSISHILFDNFENLILIGTANIDANGNAQANQITGNNGNNVLDGKGGADTLIGLGGNDTYLLDNPADSVWEGRGDGVDVVKTIFSYVLGDNLEQLVLQGTSDLNGTGNELNNDLTGNSGANILNGGDGNDTLTGGAGADTFQLTNAGNVDKIMDFSVIEDTIQLDNNVFSSLGAEGVLSASKLRSGTGISTAADANDYLIYNSTDGKLYYDSDAVGANAAVQIALLGKGLVLTSDDFLVI